MLFLLVCGAVAVFGVASPPVEPLDGLEGTAKLDALIERVVEQQHAIETLRADFVQLKNSSMLLEASESSGTFLFRSPDRVRWDYSEPDAMVVLFADDTVTTFHPAQARAERIKVSKKQRRFVRVLAGTQPLDELKQHFSVTLADPGGDARYLLKLRPVGNILKKKLKSVEIEVDRSLLLPVVVEYNEADGDSTRYEFRNLVINPQIDESSFRLDFDSDVQLEFIDASSGLG
jgi:outer membrane lipoprotein carrier protein